MNIRTIHLLSRLVKNHSRPSQVQGNRVGRPRKGVCWLGSARQVERWAPLHHSCSLCPPSLCAWRWGCLLKKALVRKTLTFPASPEWG